MPAQPFHRIEVSGVGGSPVDACARVSPAFPASRGGHRATVAIVLGGFQQGQRGEQRVAGETLLRQHREHFQLQALALCLAIHAPADARDDALARLGAEFSAAPWLSTTRVGRSGCGRPASSGSPAALGIISTLRAVSPTPLRSAVAAICRVRGTAKATSARAARAAMSSAR